MAIQKTVYIGRDNTFDLEFSTTNVDGVESLANFSGIYSVTATLVSGATTFTATATTLTAGNIADTSPGSGIIRLALGKIPSLTAGTYSLRLSYKTASGDTEPTQLVHEQGPNPVIIRAVTP